MMKSSCREVPRLLESKNGRCTKRTDVHACRKKTKRVSSNDGKLTEEENDSQTVCGNVVVDVDAPCPSPDTAVLIYTPH